MVQMDSHLNKKLGLFPFTQYQYCFVNITEVKKH